MCSFRVLPARHVDTEIQPMLFRHLPRFCLLLLVSVANCQRAGAQEIGMPAANSGAGSGSNSTTIDVALHEAGVLLGRLVDANGATLKSVPVSLHTPHVGTITTETDQNGRFAFAGVPGGAYRLSAQQSVLMIRAWQQGTAPPSATTEIELVYEPIVRVVRGQQLCPPPTPPERIRRYMMTHPYLVGSIVVAAVALPLTIENEDDAS